jgi:hypothetical protein
MAGQPVVYRGTGQLSGPSQLSVRGEGRSRPGPFGIFRLQPVRFLLRRASSRVGRGVMHPGQPRGT